MNVFQIPNFIGTALFKNPPFLKQSFFDHSWNGTHQNSLLSIHPRTFPANPYGVITDLSPEQFKEKLAHVVSVRLTNDGWFLDGRYEPIQFVIDDATSLVNSSASKPSKNQLQNLTNIISELLRKDGIKSPFNTAFKGSFDYSLVDYKNKIHHIDDYPTLINDLVNLVGRGPGLTPSGDDFIVGFLAVIWFVQNHNFIQLCQPAFAQFLDRQVTTLISTFYLQAALQGHFVSWIKEIYLALLNEKEMNTALFNLAQMGHSSGVDTLYGLYEGLMWIQKKGI